MNDLRLTLILLGVAVIVGVYVWDRLQARRGPRREGDMLDAGEDDHLDLKISTRGKGDEEDMAPFLSALRHGRSADTELPADPVTLGRGSEAGGEAAGHDDIVTLHVVADPDTPFTGPAILRLFRELGLIFGDMNIYHCYGIKGTRTSRPWFHLANMLEPGSFDPDNMETFTTRGLSLFTQLPTPVNSEVVLDLMLETAWQLAERLGGEVLTHDRQVLTDTYVEALRAKLNRKH